MKTDPHTPATGSQSPASARSRPSWAPSRRLTAALAGVMLAVGVAVGAAIGPAPNASLAGVPRLPLLLGALIARAHAGQAKPTTTGVQPPASAETTAPRRRRRRKHAGAAAAAETSPATESTGSSGSKAKGKGNGASTVPLPAVTKVWVLELSGASFTEALAQPASAPYINSKAIPAGTLLNGWSSLQASAFASDAALIATTEPQLVETILQPLCPEGAAGAQCAPDTPGALKVADEFLAQTLPAITSSAAYRSSGLIVVTFSSIAAGAASGLPAGSTTATLSSQAPAGALLISPFARAGKRLTTTFNPSSPRQSLDALLRR
jgi:hypothetical protein